MPGSLTHWFNHRKPPFQQPLAFTLPEWHQFHGCGH
jgi:hypothetical protein